MLELKNIEKRYHTGKVLHHINMLLLDHGMVGIVGPSGCGKSTLLHIIGGIDHDYSGNLVYNGKSIDKRLQHYRNHDVSFIFQNIHLIDIFNILTNIKLPLFFSRKQVRDNDDYNIDYNQKISSLSLGQRQIIAYIRSVFSKKKILLCDEPTASLDYDNAVKLMEFLKEESKDHLVILVSHNEQLVHAYCNEVYTMNDGHIINHKIIREKKQKTIHYNSYQKIRFPHLHLSLLSLKAYKKRTRLLILGLFISLLCVFSSITLSSSLETQIYDYIYSLVPPSSISFKSHQQIHFDDVSQLANRKDISRVQLFLDDYELLGIGFNHKRYKEEETLFISDDSSPYEHMILSYGHQPSSNQEILLSLSTAQQLSENIETLIGKKIYAFYKINKNVISIEYCISGITNTSTLVDTIYQRPNAYIELLKKQHQLKDLKSSLGIIYVHPDYNRSEIIDDLEITYKDYAFKETGLSTTTKVKDVLSKVKTVLYLFTFLAVLSSLFLIGEVMYLNVIEESKNYAIMFCFGASIIDIIKIVSYETLMILLSSFILCVVVFYQLMGLGNIFLKDVLLSQTFQMSLSYEYILYIFIGSSILIFISLLFSFIHIYKMNIVDTLKK